MNILFEGTDGVGKTTLIKRVVEQLAKDGYVVNDISELEKTPLRSLLSDILKKDMFFRSNEKFKTSIYETFLLSAHFFYKQEYFRGNGESINFYDRDIFTLLCYQKQILKLEYGEKANRFFKHLTECLMFDLKNIDLLVYVSVPETLGFDRIEKRDNIKLTQNQKDFLVKTKECFEEIVKTTSQQENISILLIDGSQNLESNTQIITRKIKCIN